MMNSNNIYRAFLALIIVTLISGCNILKKSNNETNNSRISGYNYTPIDPFPVTINRDIYSCIKSKTKVNGQEVSNPLLRYLPDNTVRMSIQQIDSSGSISYGPIAISGADKNYIIIVDYVNSDTIDFPVYLYKKAIKKASLDSNGEPIITSPSGPENTYQKLNLYHPIDPNEYDINSVQYISEIASYVHKHEASNGLTVNTVEHHHHEEPADYKTKIHIPLYVGVGLRVTAAITSLKNNININGLGSIGIEAENNKIKGNLLVQTLGINGKSIAAALPIQSELNRTTAQNAIVAIGSIKALLYDDSVTVAPRVVGMYLPIESNVKITNSIISSLSKSKTLWNPLCSPPEEERT